MGDIEHGSKYAGWRQIEARRSHAEAHDVIAIDQALTALKQQSPRLAQVIEMRFFAGMSVEDTAAALEMDPRSIVRDWQKARLFLHRALTPA